MPDTDERERVERTVTRTLTVTAVEGNWIDVTPLGDASKSYVAGGDYRVIARNGEGLELRAYAKLEEAPRVGDLVTITVTRLV